MDKHRILMGILGPLGSGTNESSNYMSVRRGPKVWFPVVLAVLMGVIGLACATSSNTPDIVPDRIAEQGLAPNFTFNLYQGRDTVGLETRQLAQLRGIPVVLNFWARLCPPCWAEMPELQEFSEEFEGQILLLGIDIGQFTGFGIRRDASKLLEAMGITYPAGFTDDGIVVEQYGVTAMPTTVFIDGNGKIFQKWTGALDRSTVTRLAETMLIGE